eukprot:9718714-Alexandrium_andersonii.AAC.1
MRRLRSTRPPDFAGKVSFPTFRFPLPAFGVELGPRPVADWLASWRAAPSSCALCPAHFGGLRTDR